jgi:UDP-galactopyranose mutase
MSFDVYQIYDAIIYTGPIDQYIKDSNHPKLEYRSIDFQYKRLLNIPYYQANSVVNYPEFAVNYARVVEYKHFLNQKSPHTIIVSETTTSNGEPSKFEIV